MICRCELRMTGDQSLVYPAFFAPHEDKHHTKWIDGRIPILLTRTCDVQMAVALLDFFFIPVQQLPSHPSPPGPKSAELHPDVIFLCHGKSHSTPTGGSPRALGRPRQVIRLILPALLQSPNEKARCDSSVQTADGCHLAFPADERRLSRPSK